MSIREPNAEGAIMPHEEPMSIDMTHEKSTSRNSPHEPM
jgi:hypothetical protein